MFVGFIYLFTTSTSMSAEELIGAAEVTSMTHSECECSYRGAEEEEDTQPMWSDRAQYPLASASKADPEVEVKVGGATSSASVAV